jgi:hypothetical protein
LLFFLAFWFGNSFKDLVDRIERDIEYYRPILIMAAIVAVAVYFFFHFLRKPVPTGDPKELPLIGQKVAATIEHLSPSAAHIDIGHPPSANGQEATKPAPTPKPHANEPSS